MPSNLVAKYKGLLNWLEKYRVPFFCKTNLCLHYILCEELVSFIRSPEAAEMLRWKRADQWLLEKCIAGSRGMWRFRSFMQGMAGEDLTKFWLAAERILAIDETDESQQDLYISLMQVLMATHLQEGSTVVTLCNTSVESLLKTSPHHPQHARTRREILSEMQKVALFKIESYWLPNFYIHCKLSMENEPKCRHLLKEYQQRLRKGSTPRFSLSPSLAMTIRASCDTTTSYCSLKSKRMAWEHITGRSVSRKGKRKGHRKQRSRKSSPTDRKRHHSGKHSTSPSPSPHRADHDKDDETNSDILPSCKSSPNSPGGFPYSPVADEIAEMGTVSRLRSSTPMVQVPSMLALKSPVKSPMCLDFLPWALTADKCAGRPFRNFLLCRTYAMEVHLLDLWHDLEDFLRMMLCSLGEGNILLRHVMGERICELYLTQNNNWHLPLKLTTLRNLQNLLPSGHVIPWVLKAQKEICKILSFLYEDFLQHDDKMFLFYVSGKEKKTNEEPPYEHDESLRMIRRIIESMHLSQALAGMRDFDLLSGEHWRLLGTQDLNKGGSIFMEVESPVWKHDYSTMPFDELAWLNPKMAVELLSQNFRAFCKSCETGGVFIRPIVARRSLHWTRSSLSFMRRGPPSRKPLAKPRSLTELLQNPMHLDYFRHFLKMNNSETPLLFVMSVEEIVNETNPRIQRILVNECVRTYFFNPVPAETLLQCDADIIKEIPRANVVTVPMLVLAQMFVMNSLQETWFKSYQGLYPSSDISIAVTGPKARRSSVITDKLKKCWCALGGLIKTVCRFRKAMSYVSQRKRFEEFLQRELKNDKENMPVTTRQSISGPSGRHAPHSGGSDDIEVVQVRRKIFGNRIILVNFLVNDLYFYLEMERFFHVADSVVVLAALGLYTEKDIAFLKSKVVTINKLFLNSDIPPKLRVNLTDSQVSQIRNQIAEGQINRTLYHSAIMSIFPVLLYFWKKYCHWKVMRSFKKLKREKSTISPASPPTPSKISRKASIFTGSEDHPIIRYSILKGIQLLLPQPRYYTDEVPGEKSSIGSLTNYGKSPSAIYGAQRRVSSHIGIPS
ncbi:regulator of G-protein signaling protein-like [Anolis sagrei]|uniref:regulator of G-protein signaling protein-like n=1 Tax=Anolis sagrei TaxID=38937 RepID=UPI003522ACA8